jgi:hypothetical protein
VVPNESSELGYPSKERTNFINANHMNMCRFKDEHDDGYIKTKGEIKRHLERRRFRAEVGHGAGTAQMPAECESSLLSFVLDLGRSFQGRVVCYKQHWLGSWISLASIVQCDIFFFSISLTCIQL